MNSIQVGEVQICFDGDLWPSIEERVMSISCPLFSSLQDWLGSEKLFISGSIRVEPEREEKIVENAEDEFEKLAEGSLEAMKRIFRDELEDLINKHVKKMGMNLRISSWKIV